MRAFAFLLAVLLGIAVWQGPVFACLVLALSVSGCVAVVAFLIGLGRCLAWISAA